MRKIIFVCAENAGRSQMAEAFFNTFAVGTDFGAESAGTMPAPAVNPIVVAAMQEKGIDVSTNKPKLFDPATADQYDRLISFGCLVKLAFSPIIQAKIEDWDVDNTEGKDLVEIRTIRDIIETRVKKLLASL